MSDSNVVQMARPAIRPNNNGGNGSNGGGNLESRLTRLETDMGYVAIKRSLKRYAERNERYREHLHQMAGRDCRGGYCIELLGCCCQTSPQLI